MRLVQWMLFGGVVLLMAACSTSGRVSEIAGTRDTIAMTHRHEASVSVFVTGGDESFVSSKTFGESLVRTIESTGLFSSATLAGSGTYDLSVVILSMTHSWWGDEYSVSSLWTLSSADGKEIWSETIGGTGTSDIMGGNARMRESSERAAKSAIEMGVAKLSALEL